MATVLSKLSPAVTSIGVARVNASLTAGLPMTVIGTNTVFALLLARGGNLL
jgi:hypothetical protein